MLYLLGSLEQKSAIFPKKKKKEKNKQTIPNKQSTNMPSIEEPPSSYLDGGDASVRPQVKI